ncbi:hypothetical protein WME76_39440 [Sorangium sp. So ce119]|uniref:hypothetical protein n=1 Tax=Sorangium sp. So ce119 TaxID=3133279 RepID=UPI003F61D0CA
MAEHEGGGGHLEGGEQPLRVVERQLGPLGERVGRQAPEVQQAEHARGGARDAEHQVDERGLRGGGHVDERGGGGCRSLAQQAA